MAEKTIIVYCPYCGGLGTHKGEECPLCFGHGMVGAVKCSEEVTLDFFKRITGDV
jgi:DnaJ-class molecular chaperone